MTKLKSVLPLQQVQNPIQCWRALGCEVDCEYQQGKGLRQQRLKKNIYFILFSKVMLSRFDIA